MGLGPIPFPTELHYIVGEPIHLPHGPEAADDFNIVAELHREVTETTQRLIDRGLEERRIADTGAGADTDTDTDTDTGSDSGSGSGSGTPKRPRAAPPMWLR
jgi:hypothetical protein